VAILLAIIAVENLIYHVILKPTELFAFVGHRLDAHLKTGPQQAALLVNFSVEVSKNEHRACLATPHGGCITAPQRHPPVTESVALPPEPRRATMSFHFRPLCPICQTATVLARLTSGRLGFHIRSFECPPCSEIHQIVAELADPMKSGKGQGWLRSELRAPT
jgi:hypothetical protein